MLRSQDDELAYVRETFMVDRRELDVLRSHFGEDILFARSGVAVAVARLSEVAESGDKVRFDVSRTADLMSPTQLFLHSDGPLVEISDDDFRRATLGDRSRPLELHEDDRRLMVADGRTDSEMDVIAAYGWGCALTSYQAHAPVQALRRLEVVYLIPLDLGGEPVVTNALPVDAAIAYALQFGNVVIGDDYRIEVAHDLPVVPPHPLRSHLLPPLNDRDRPAAESLAFHRNLFRPL